MDSALFTVLRNSGLQGSHTDLLSSWRVGQRTLSDWGRKTKRVPFVTTHTATDSVFVLLPTVLQEAAGLGLRHNTGDRDGKYRREFEVPMDGCRALRNPGSPGQRLMARLPSATPCKHTWKGPHTQDSVWQL